MSFFELNLYFEWWRGFRLKRFYFIGKGIFVGFSSCFLFLYFGIRRDVRVSGGWGSYFGKMVLRWVD